MDLATMVIIATCSGHCKRVIGQTDFVGVPTMAECSLSLEKSAFKRGNIVRLGEGENFTYYARCLPISPCIVNFPNDHSAKPRSKMWTYRHPRLICGG